MSVLSLIYKIIAAKNSPEKNSSIKNWHNQKNIHTFALLKQIQMRYMPSNIKTEQRFSPIEDYTTRGACFAIH